MRSINDVLDLAIRNEEESASFYLKWAGVAALPAARKLLQSLAKDEKFHREKLRRIRDGQLSFSNSVAMQSVIDLARQGREKPIPSRDSDPRAVLTWAMEREKQTCKLYERLARGVEDPEVQKVLFALADQEQRHYARLDSELFSTRRSASAEGAARSGNPG